MNQAQASDKRKGGRPVKPVKRSRVLSLKCTDPERAQICTRAQKAGMTISEFLREIGSKGQIVVREKTLPREVLMLMGTLHHMAANLNQLARKRNSMTDELNIVDRVRLEMLCRELKQIAQQIKTQLT